MRFVKLHGAGNDYLFVNGFTQAVSDPAGLAARISAPHTGAGSDGLILLLPSRRADFAMRMFNSDGSAGLMCGNGARCAARFLWEEGLLSETSFTLESGGEVYSLWVETDGGKFRSATVDLGTPQSLARPDGGPIRVRFGSPHAVLFGHDGDFLHAVFEREAPKLCAELDANVEFARPVAPGVFEARVWERGSGETCSCGTGTCAILAAARTEGLADGEGEIRWPGGVLNVRCRAEDGHYLLSGPCVRVYEGLWPDDEAL